MIPFNLDIPKMGYALAWMGDGGYISNRIEKEQLKAGFNKEDSKYTHIDVSLGGQHAVRVYAFERTSIVDIRKQYSGRRVKIMRYKAEGFENKKRYKVACWAASNCNLKYDYLGVIAFLTKLIKHSLSKMFCSENYLWSLQKEFKRAIAGLAPHKCMPAHILGCEFECVWEGRVP